MFIRNTPWFDATFESTIKMIQPLHYPKPSTRRDLLQTETLGTLGTSDWQSEHDST
jgi:hypothetical protein